MEIKENIFGQGIIYNQNDLKGKIFAQCSACMSLYSEFESFANAYPEQMVQTPEEADDIIVISCQVTDLAVYNDIKTMQDFIKQHPQKKYYIGGCLANRFDIELPTSVMRLDHVRVDNQQIKERLVKYQKPFWVKELDENNEYSDGNLFRNKYPLRIGVGCKNNCSFCTIKITRGRPYEIDINKAEQEFIENDNILLISDAPTTQQIFDWVNLAIKHSKQISIRNVEPVVALQSFSKLKELAEHKLLKEFHSPVQHTEESILKAMHRNAPATLQLIEKLKELRKLGVYLATNIIIDYKINNEKTIEPNFEKLYETFHYISWNPYWDGKWNYDNAKVRFEEYFGSKK